jgi:ribosomal protein L30/L7E
MKKAILFCSLLLAVVLYSNTASAQILKKLVSSVKGDNTAASTTGAPTNLEIGTALKQALEQGTGKSSDQLSAVDGFFGNALVKIVFPPEAQKAEKTLRSLGLNKLCDDVILSLNRAAEGAAKEAKPIFIDAIKQMTLQDVTNILLGKQDAATDYFKRTTTQQLSAKFKPVIQISLDKAGATKYYTTAATTFNKVPFVKKINPDISDYVTQKAIDGLFVEIAQEELNIRKNLPSTRTTAVMQKVFSFADKMKK